MRYIAKVLKSSLHQKFPEASEDELLKVETLTCLKMSFCPQLVTECSLLSLLM